MIGRGADYCTALEASLKIKETSYVNADVYFAGELKHGFLALVDENSYVAVFATDETTLQKTLSNAEEARARGAKIILFTTAAPEKLCGAEKKCFRILRIQNCAAFARAMLIRHYCRQAATRCNAYKTCCRGS